MDACVAACWSLKTGAYRHYVELDFIRPGRPREDRYIESFNGRLRDECLNAELFSDLLDARTKLDAWRRCLSLQLVQWGWAGLNAGAQHWRNMDSVAAVMPGARRTASSAR